MQTFLPYPDIVESVKCLDYRRLGKQRVEAFFILKALHDPNYGGGYQRHPCVNQWRGHAYFLTVYYNHTLTEWIRRGHTNTLPYIITEPKGEKPWWFGMEEYHASHRSNLLRKDPEYYSRFGWKEANNIPYWWPSHHLLRKEVHNHEKIHSIPFFEKGRNYPNIPDTAHVDNLSACDRDNRPCEIQILP